MPKFFTTFLVLLLTFSLNIFVTKAATRFFDFNTTSDLTDFFNSDGDPKFTISSVGGIGLSGSVEVDLGYEDIWTSKKGYNISGEGNVLSTSGYFRNEINSGYGSLGFTNTNASTGDGLGSPNVSIGFVFHGGGGYFVNNGVYTDIFWPPDLELDTWYRFKISIEKKSSNKFDVNVLVHETNELGNLISLKHAEYIEVTNSDLSSATILYSYFGTADSRFTRIDNIEVDLTGGATFEEDGKPALTTVTVTSITTNSGVSGGNVTNSFGSEVTARGVCFGTSPNPTTSGTCTSDGTGPGSFISNLSSLTTNTLYYYRAYATNTNGTGYGNQATFRTSSINNQTNTNSSRRVFKKPSCLNKKPSNTTWILITPHQLKDKKGILLTWSQVGADRVTIMIDNGSNKYPYVISRTKNDGKEFIPNISSKQRIKIIPHNGCARGNESPGISSNSHPKGYFNHKK